MDIVGLNRNAYLTKMVRLEITVLFVRHAAGAVSATVLAVRPGRAVINMELEFPLAMDQDPVQATYDEALAYLDIA